jgi:very-short-patch-repair endonuclease
VDPSAIAAALEQAGAVDLAALGSNPHRSARRHGLVLVQPRVALAATQPVGARELMYAVAASVPEPRALLSGAALWAHGQGPLPAVVEIGVVGTRGLTVRSPVVPRRLAPATLVGVVVRRGLPVVPLEMAVVQRSATLTDPQVLVLVERVLRARATTTDRLRAACRRGLAGSRPVRAALVVLDGGDLELQKRRLRAALVAAGVGQLRSEVRFVSRSGASCYVDLLHEPSRKAVELDGGYHDLPAQRQVDRRKDRWLRRDHGIEVLRVADEEVRRDVAAVAAELLPELLPERR